MTLHIPYNHQCAKCQAYYIPYEKNVPCPNCGFLEDERFDYIPQALASLKYNLETEGSYLPAGWWVGSLGDHILFILFKLFEQFKTQKEQADFATFAKDALEKIDWGSQTYLKKHIHSIALRIYEEIKSNL
jgi:hypothetical protein